MLGLVKKVDERAHGKQLRSSKMTCTRISKVWAMFEEGKMVCLPVISEPSEAIGRKTRS